MEDVEEEILLFGDLNGHAEHTLFFVMVRRGDQSKVEVETQMKMEGEDVVLGTPTTCLVRHLTMLTLQHGHVMMRA